MSDNLAVLVAILKVTNRQDDLHGSLSCEPALPLYWRTWMQSRSRLGSGPSGSGYQDAFLIPGSLPSSAISRKVMRERPSSRYTARDRPQTKLRVLSRTSEDLRGSLDSCPRASIRSSCVRLWSRARFLSSLRLGLLLDGVSSWDATMLEPSDSIDIGDGWNGIFDGLFDGIR